MATAALLLRQKTKRDFSQFHRKCSNINRLMLITVDVFGSTGPIRFIVNEDELVNTVIYTALKSYARENRLPVLGFDATNFLLYCANAEFKAMGPTEAIGSCEGRKFVLSKKQNEEAPDDHRDQKEDLSCRLKARDNGKKIIYRGEKKKDWLGGSKICDKRTIRASWGACISTYIRQIK